MIIQRFFEKKERGERPTEEEKYVFYRARSRETKRDQAAKRKGLNPQQYRMMLSSRKKYSSEEERKLHYKKKNLIDRAMSKGKSPDEYKQERIEELTRQLHELTLIDV